MDGRPLRIPRLKLPAGTFEQHELVACTIIDGAPYTAFYIDDLLIVVELISDEEALEKYGTSEKRAVRLIRRQADE